MDKWKDRHTDDSMMLILIADHTTSSMIG